MRKKGRADEEVKKKKKNRGRIISRGKEQERADEMRTIEEQMKN